MNMSSFCKASEKGKGVEDSVDTNMFYSGFEFFQGFDDIAEPVLFPSQYDLYPDIASPSFQACGMLSTTEPQGLQPNEEKMPCTLFPSASMAILRHCTNRVGAVDGERRDILKIETKGKRASPLRLSVTHIIELAAGNFIHSNSEIGRNLSAFSHPYGTAFLGLSTDDGKDIQLVQDLLLCAEKVCSQQYGCASKLLEECSKLTCSRINVIQRLVYYFTEALREKIEQETGRFSGKCIVNEGPLEFITSISATAAFLEKLPFNQVTQFAGIQSIVDHVSARRKVHVIDLDIHGGPRLAILMQALVSGSESLLQHLKITAVATQSKLLINEAGIRLKSFAKSLNLSFSFQVISIEDIINLHQNLDRGETVVVQASHALRFMIPKPGQLEKLMRVIRSVNPHVMIVTEIEANINSPVFVNRFSEALFYFGAYFEYMECFLKNDHAEKEFVESKLFSPTIRQILAADGEERMFRFVGLNVWRAFFARFGMVETELSKLALNHANLVLNRFDYRDSCMLGLNGKSLTVSWKDTPIFSLSAWKFHGMRSI